MLRKIFYFLLFLALVPTLMAATKGRVRGTVVDLQTGEPLIGSNVIVVGSSIGAATDANGDFVLLNLEAGVYDIRASYLGYQTITLTNVRVNADLTTYVTFELPDEEVTVENVVVVATRPLIQKDATNATRITTSEDIEALPIRGVNNIISLSAGVVLQDNFVFIRGGRFDEVGFYLEGNNITNVVLGGRGVTISQDALEEIQVQSGGYQAEFGGANAGIIRQQLKSGGPKLRATFEYITDNIGFKSPDDTFDGEKTLGAYTYGYEEMSATLGGPLFDNRIKFFANVRNLFRRDPNTQPYAGVNIGLVKDQVSGDSINLVYPAGPIRGRASNNFTYVGTLNFDFKPFLIRLTGTYTTVENQTQGRGFGDAGGVPGYPIGNILNTRYGMREDQDGSFSAKITHVLSPSLFYEVSGGFTINKDEGGDPDLWENYWAYGDSAANAAVGWDVFDGEFQRPERLNVMNFTFYQNGDLPRNYFKRETNSLDFSASLSYLIGNIHSIKLGGTYQQYTSRNWALSVSTHSLAGTLDQFTKSTEFDGDLRNAQSRILIQRAGVNNWGYDEFGNELDDDKFFGAKKPVFASAYIQDRIEFEDIILNLGLRYDYIDVDDLEFADPLDPASGINHQTFAINEAGFNEVEAFSSVSPRIGVSFPITDQTVFHAQYGKFVQQPRLADLYTGWYRWAFQFSQSFFFGNPEGTSLDPTRTTQYELGFTQQIGDNMSFDITGYYKDVKDQVVFRQIFTDNSSIVQDYNISANGDFATTKGVEVSFNMRRTSNLAINANISFQDAQGTGSFPNSQRGVVGAPVNNLVFVPQYVSPLDFNRSFSGNINLDYRFGADEGNALLNQLGVSVLAAFSSGHPFTLGEGGADLEGDARDRQPLQSLNSSSTPSTFQLDLRVDKTFDFFDLLDINIYFRAINLLDSENIQNVFLRTGTHTDDGFLTNPEFSAQLIETHGEVYKDVYSAINLNYYEQYQQSGVYANPLIFGPPKQYQLGIRLEY